jgi:hypothetical protein
MDDRIHINGYVSHEDAQRMAQQAGERAIAIVKAKLPEWQREIETYGVVQSHQPTVDDKRDLPKAVEPQIMTVAWLMSKIRNRLARVIL